MIFILGLSQTNRYQKTNSLFYFSKQAIIYCTSIDGLISYNSKEIKILKVINSRDQNILSSFYEDDQETIWSTNYTSLIYKLKNKSKFYSIIPKDSTRNSINSSYKIYGQVQDNLILKLGGYLVEFNTISRSIESYFPVDIITSSTAVIFNIKGEINVFYGKKDSLCIINKSTNKNRKTKLESEIFSIDNMLNNILAIGFSDGSIGSWDENQEKLLFTHKVSNSAIQGIKRLNDTLAVLSNGSKILFWNYLNNKIVDSLTLYTKGECKTPLTRLIIPYVDPDSILWIGSDGYGVVSHDLKPKKLKLLNDQLCELNTLAILPKNDIEYFIVSRGGKISYFNSKSKYLECIKELSGIKDNPVFYKSAILKDSVIYLCTWTELYSYDLRSRTIIKLRNLSGDLKEFFEFRLTSDGRVFSSGNSMIVELILSSKEYTWKKIKGIDMKEKSLTYFDFDNEGNIYSGYNEETILYYRKISSDSFSLEYEYKIPGGVKCITKVLNDSIRYISTSSGLYSINILNRTYKKLSVKEGLLDQTIYAVYPRGEYLWMSSNSGILRLNPKTMDLHQFAEKDGLQGSEFNTFSYSFTDDGYIFFGGTNGVNYFNPDLVMLSDKEVPVRITDFKINDVISDRYEEPDIIESLELPYAENTLSFEIISVDFHDQSLTRVKHKLEGIDKDYVLSSTSTGIMRYANLDPGKYKLEVLGSNADKVWNKKPRVIEITIVPPFWMTGWFRFLSIFIILSSSYKLVRDYYKRQLEKKNLLLKQQQLIIEKQEAVEQERTRIASEMHDDLGSGLTTIRYLSDRALKNVAGEEEKNQIRRIADQSNTLVRNMSEIIWAMNSRFDSLDNLISYIRRYAIEFLEEHSIAIKWEQDEISESIQISGSKRRAIFLVVKEALHNVVKHARADVVRIKCSLENSKVHIAVADNGIGFDPLISVEKGNGIYNMKKRIEEVNGDLHIQRVGGETVISIIFSLD